VTIGALVALCLAVANLTSYVAGLEIRGDRPAFAGVAAYTALMLVAAWGMWRARYWAVLGMQALLGLLIVIFAVVAMTAANAWAVIVSILVIVPAGTLFWFLVKAMARIQMPTRP
jgi:hydrogenase-4 membrane subunit HyfE